jgi:hypothetical protein
VGGTASALSEARVLTPRSTPTFVETERVDGGFLLRFSGALALGDHRLTLTCYPRNIDASDAAALVEGGHAVFVAERCGEAAVIRWSGLRGIDGAPVPDGSARFAPVAAGEAFVVARWEEAGEFVRVHFSQPLSSSAADPMHFSVSPAGVVDEARFPGDDRRVLDVRVRGVAVGASGLNVTLTIAGSLTSQAGAPLEAASRAILLTRAADDLSGVFVYPNPLRLSSGAGALTVAGLPPAATLRIVQPDGTPVASMTELDRDGGVRWDLRDASGRIVAPGVYLILVSLEGQTSVLHKAAVLP